MPFTFSKEGCVRRLMNPAPPQPHVLFRYLQGGWVYLRELRRTQWLSADELHALQLRRLRELLREAAANVPYYQSLFQKLGATPCWKSNRCGTIPTSFSTVAATGAA